MRLYPQAMVEGRWKVFQVRTSDTMATTTSTTMKPPISYDINLPYLALEDDVHPTTKYPEYLPSWDKIRFDPLPVFPYEDPALRAKDRTKPSLLGPGVAMQDIQPGMGSIVNGMQLSQLSDNAKDELALLISERKVLAFPEQDLIDAGPARQQEFMKYFGKLNYQPVSGSVKGYPAFHIIHRDGNKEELTRFFEQKATSTLWHQDVSYEVQPPGYVMLGLLQGPEVGGDTVFAATDKAYEYVLFRRPFLLILNRLSSAKSQHHRTGVFHPPSAPSSTPSKQSTPPRK